MDVARGIGSGGAGLVQRGPASEDCNKSGQDMDMSLLLLRLERLGHLKIAAGLQATTSRQIPHPQPLLPFSAPPLNFLPAPLSRQVCVCVCVSLMCEFFMARRKQPPSGRHAGVRVAMSTGASTSC